MVKKLIVYFLLIIIIVLVFLSLTYRNNTVLIAHRGGLSHLYPENSMESFINATQYTNFIEMDIQFTKDHEQIILHDSTLDRTTSCKGKVSNTIFKDISKCKLRLNTNQTVSPFSIPYFKDVLKNTYLMKSILIVEIKEYNKIGIDNIYNLIKNKDNVYIQSLSLEVLNYLHQKYNYKYLFLVSRKIPEQYPVWLTGLILEYKYINSNILKQINPKYKIYIWTINDDIEYQKFNELKVDGIMTDDIRYFSKYSKEWNE